MFHNYVKLFLPTSDYFWLQRRLLSLCIIGGNSFEYRKPNALVKRVLLKSNRTERETEDYCSNLPSKNAFRVSRDLSA